MVEITPIAYNNDNYAYLLNCPKTGETALIDAGEKKPILDALQKKNVDLKKILCTHHHFDHIAAIPKIKADYPNLEVFAHKNTRGKIPEAKHFLEEGGSVEIGKTTLEVLESFGHTQSCISYYSKQENILFSGDCLFLAGCGRLLEGTAEQLYNSLDKVKALPPQTKVYFGHNYNLNNLKFALSVEPKNQKLVARYDAENKKQKNISACCQTTIQKELETNPFLRLNSKEISNSIAEKIGRKAENTLDLFTQLRYLKDKF